MSRHPPAAVQPGPAPRLAPPSPGSGTAPPWSRTGPAARDAAPSSDPEAARAPARRSWPRDRTAPTATPEPGPSATRITPRLRDACLAHADGHALLHPHRSMPDHASLVDTFTWGDLPGTPPRPGRRSSRPSPAPGIPRRERIPEAQEQLLLHGPLELNDHVAAEDRCWALRRRVPASRSSASELDRRAAAPAAGRQAARRRPACAQLQRRLAQREGPRTPPGAPHPGSPRRCPCPAPGSGPARDRRSPPRPAPPAASSPLNGPPPPARRPRTPDPERPRVQLEQRSAARSPSAFHASGFGRTC